MKIGIDLDNTIICYDQAFYQAARDLGLLGFSNIQQARYELRQQLHPDVWTELQGSVYGPYIRFAFPFPQVDLFFKRCASKHIFLYIVSHKTLQPCRGPAYNLREAAKQWIMRHPFLANTEVFFESTMKDKVKKIEALGCDIFIDDLEHLLLRKDFPSVTRKILFDPQGLHESHPAYEKASSWTNILEMLDI